MNTGILAKTGLLVASAVIFLTGNGAPVAAQPVPDGEPAAVATTVPAGTIEYDAFSTTLRDTLDATQKDWQRLVHCDTWACAVASHRRIDDALTRGIQWMYHHPALPCYQQQQQRATKGLQETRGAFRMLMLAIQTGSSWRQRVANAKIAEAQRILQDLPGHTCPASADDLVADGES
jgi:hypothetical protein